MLLVSRYIPTSIPPRAYAFHDELWTNGRTDCALLLLSSSKAGRTNPVRVDGLEVLVENSSADPMHTDWDLHITIGVFVSMLTNFRLGNIDLSILPSLQGQGIKWWSCYSHYLSKLCLRMNVSQNSDLMRYVELQQKYYEHCWHLSSLKDALVLCNSRARNVSHAK